MGGGDKMVDMTWKLSPRQIEVILPIFFIIYSDKKYNKYEQNGKKSIRLIKSQFLFIYEFNSI